MAQKSSVEKLPKEVQDWIMRLREQGATYDTIVAKLRELDTLAVVPSRSALHRHIQEAERLRELMQRQVVIATAVAKDLDGTDDSKMARGNVAMLQNILMRVQAAALYAAEDGDGSVDLSPGELMQLAKAMDHLAKAAKDDVARTVLIEKRAQEKVLKKAEAAVSAAQADGEPLDGLALIKKIREDIYGIYEP